MGTNKCPMLQTFKIVLWKINPVDYFFFFFVLSIKKISPLEFRYIHTSDEMKTSFLLTKAAFVNDALDRAFFSKKGRGRKEKYS